MHLSTLDIDRFRSKNRWYQCWEFLNQKWDGRTFELYRFYHRELFIAQSRLKKLESGWVDGYKPVADPLSYRRQVYYRWDNEMLDLLIKHGPAKFRQLAIWDVDWDEMHRVIRGEEAPISLGDPRSQMDKIIHQWLKETQPLYCEGAPQQNRFARLRHRMARRLVKKLGW